MWNIKYLKETRSTQDDALNFLAEAVNPKPHIFYSFNQLRGYGRGGKRWLLGELTLASTFLVPEQSHRKSLVLNQSISVCLIVLELLERYLNKPRYHFSLKWPNDLLKNGIKFGGILINRVTVKNETWLVVGLGLNLFWGRENTAFYAVGVFDSLNAAKKFNSSNFLIQLGEKFLEKPPASEQKDNAKEFNRRDFYHLKNVTLLNEKNKQISGTNLGIDRFGSIIIKVSGGKKIHIPNGSFINK